VKQNRKQMISKNKQTPFMQKSNYHNEKISKTEQFLQECAGWLRLLDFFKQENSFLKTRLSMVVDHKTDNNFLALAEHFQNLFILKDEFISEITHDVKRQEIILKEAEEKKISPDEFLVKKQQKLRNETEYFEKDFSATKNEFNKFIASVL
jgi:hypothetical protein